SITNEPGSAAAWGTGYYTLLANATDGAGNVSTNASVNFYVDQTAPTVAITNPTNNEFFNAVTVVSSISTAAGNNLMKGTATDDLTGVASMGAKLIRLSGGSTTYWNGAAWVGADPGYNSLTIATVPAIPGAAGSPVLSTAWSITNEPGTAAAWGTGYYTLLVNATDGAGNLSADTSVNFYVDQLPPTVVITNPTTNEYFNALTVVSSISTAAGSNLMKGTATDDLTGVSSLAGKLIRFDLTGTTNYWNGATWQVADPGYNSLTITTAPAIPGAAGSPVNSLTWNITNEPANAGVWGTGRFTLLMHGTDGAN